MSTEECHDDTNGCPEDINIQHEDIEILLLCDDDRESMFEIIADNPQYYLGLIQTYEHTRDGSEIYLPDLFNIIMKRENNCLTIKFKLYDNDKWESVGYDSNDHTDDDVYKAFTEKVNFLLKFPRKKPTSSNYIKVHSDELDAMNIKSGSICDQNVTSKLKKYLMKNKALCDMTNNIDVMIDITAEASEKLSSKLDHKHDIFGGEQNYTSSSATSIPPVRRKNIIDEFIQPIELTAKFQELFSEPQKLSHKIEHDHIYDHKHQSRVVQELSLIVRDSGDADVANLLRKIVEKNHADYLHKCLKELGEKYADPFEKMMITELCKSKFR